MVVVTVSGEQVGGRGGVASRRNPGASPVQAGGHAEVISALLLSNAR